ncbi:MAG TPA: DEAD/DEAH box helicase family protein, partial [Candidatus Cloacimonadota bacterium]|nr:DEAD/DEAH box helicase family protein [Candidatus Cloacimonadota bacterium]
MLARRNRNNPLEFRKKLVLNQWLINLFGVNPLSEANHNELPFHRLSAPIRSVDPEGLDTDGLHRFYHALVNSELFYNNSSSLTREQLLSYEENIARHTLFINRRRNRPIVWKYFQWLSLLFVEIYLDRYFTNREGLLNDLNSFIMQFNEHWVGYENVNPYTDDDLNKICMQNATGSGKTLIMHVNLLQFRHYAKKTKLGRDISHVILITPNEGLTEQHLEELNQSGFGLAQRLKSGQEGSLEQIDVLEITKLGDKSGPNTKATRDLGDQNLLLVDEGHRGMSGTEEGAFFTRRAQLCGRGFTFEYSATFEQAVAASSSQVLAESYAKAILFDYSYRWFYEDGFGKDYQILNLPRSLEEVQDIYLTACLLKFYQQLLLFKDKRKELELFNLEKPLWVFVGSTVTKKKGNQQILVPTADLITDVGKVIKFIADFLSRPQVFQRYINQLMNGTGADTGLLDGSGNDIFHSSFQYLKIYYIAQSDPAAIYAHILLHLFNNSGGGHLSLTRIKGESGEIALYAGNSDSSFGLINVGDSKGLCEHIDFVAKRDN